MEDKTLFEVIIEAKTKKNDTPFFVTVYVVTDTEESAIAKSKKKVTGSYGQWLYNIKTKSLQIMASTFHEPSTYTHLIIA
jgi:hypothetical protein